MDKEKAVCRIEIMFPVESDEKALAVKKAVSDILKEHDTKARFQFMIMEK